ncbi:MAG: hypothetical protein AB1791_15785 [Chloroflexota bacterium]
MINRRPLTILIGAAVFSLAVYLLLFVRPFPLLTLYDQPLLDLRRRTADLPLVRWQLIAGFILLSGLYWLGYRAVLAARGRRAWLVVMGAALTFMLALCFLYPFDAADVFDNILHGRILGVHGANPFQQVARDFRQDPFFPYVAWKRTPSAYGPLWESLAGLLARLAGDSILVNVLVFKAAGGVALLAGLGLVASFLRQTAPEKALAGVYLLAWNPLILYETVGNGHNDVVMALWVILAAWAIQRRRYTLAVVSLVVGALIKFIPVLLLPAAGLIALRELPTWRGRLRFVLITGLLAALLVVAAYLPFWHGSDTLSISRRQRLFTSSLPTVAYVLLKPRYGEAAAETISLVSLGATGLFALWQGVAAARSRHWWNFSQAAFNVLMFYLLLACLWFQAWYTVWPLALAPLLPAGHGRRLGLLFGFAALSKQLIFEPLWLWHPTLNPPYWYGVRLGLGVMSVPWLYALWGLVSDE